MRRIAAVILAAIMIVMCAGCAAEPAATPSPTAEPTVAPTPTPEPKVGLEAVFDKETISVAVISNADDEESALFFEGAQKEAQGMGVTVTTAAAKGRFDSAVVEAVQNGADAIIACLIYKTTDYGALSEAAEQGIAVSVFEMQQGNVPEGMSHVYFTPGGEVDMAFEAALTYPPHDAPVRLILMFESKETDAYKAYEKLYGEGKIFPKEVYVAAENEEKSPGIWLTTVLENYIEGMLDGVIAENTDMANAAFDVLESLNRTDMEVFGIGLTAETVTRMGKIPDVFVQSVGVNAPLAGVLCARASLIMLNTGNALTQELTPYMANAAGLDADDPVYSLAYADSTLAALGNEDWMDTLWEYYSTASASEEN